MPRKGWCQPSSSKALSSSIYAARAWSVFGDGGKYPQSVHPFDLFFQRLSKEESITVLHLTLSSFYEYLYTTVSMRGPACALSRQFCLFFFF